MKGGGFMKIQEIETPKGLRWIILDDNYEVIEPARDYLKYLDNLGRAPNTLKNYAFHLKTYFQYLQILNLNLNEIASKDDKSALEILADFMGWLENPHYFENILNLSLKVRSDITINIITDTVINFYDFLAKKGAISGLDVYANKRNFIQFKSFLYEMVDKKKMVKTSLLKKRINRPDKTEFVTRDEFLQLLKYCNLVRDKLLLSILFEGGVRIGEALGIFIEDIEIWNNKINLVSRENLDNKARIKNNAEGVVLLPDYTMDLLQAYILDDLEKFDTNYLFVNLCGKNVGSALQVSTVEKLFERLSEKAGFKVTPHMLRHGRGTELHEAGWSKTDIKELLRHRSPKSTDRYIHITEERMREALEKRYKDVNLSFGNNDE